MPSSILKMKSPVGVADYVDISQDALQKNLQNSFSWTECPVEIHKTGKSDPRKELVQMQKRLQWLAEQRVVDRQEFQLQLSEAKKQVRDELYERYEPLLDSHRSSKKQYSSQVTETSKIISYLREDNSRIRDEIKELKRNIVKTKKANQEQEHALLTAQRAMQELEEHVEEMEAVRLKLEDNCRIFKETLVKMKQDYKKRTSFYQMEVQTNQQYENCLARCLTHVQETMQMKNKKYNSGQGSQLENDLYKIAEEGGLEIGKCRQSQLEKSGLKLDARQLRQCQRLMSPDVLILEYKKKMDKDSETDSDSDSDSDSESDADSSSPYEVSSD